VLHCQPLPRAPAAWTGSGGCLNVVGRLLMLGLAAHDYPSD
jgi:hypothetical protein